MNTAVVAGQNCNVCGIPSNDIDRVWAKVAPMVATALEHSRGELWPEDVFDCLLVKMMQLWIAYDNERKIKACMVTQIINYPRKKFLRVVVLSGNGFDDWSYGWDFVETWARQQGCEGVEAFARRGFARRAQAVGFREYYSMVGKEFLPLDVH